jgi:putative transposase
LEPFGLLESLPAAEVVIEAERWRDHLVEIATGLPGFDPGQPS